MVWVGLLFPQVRLLSQENDDPCKYMISSMSCTNFP